MSENEELLVSICCTCYNQESFIEDCLVSLMAQKTDFRYEILIHDDASQDDTSYIINKYAKLYPDYIFPVFQNENQYSKGVGINLTFNLTRAKGKYIAFCEGDDKWIDPYKLTKQVQFLEKNLDYSMVCSNVEIVDELGQFLRRRFTFEHNFSLNSKYLLRSNHISTCSVLVRRFALRDLRDYKIHFADKYYWLSALKYGKCYFMCEEMAAYRIHIGGTYSKLKQYEKSQRRIHDYLKFYSLFPHLWLELSVSLFREVMKYIGSMLKSQLIILKNI
jgi:glycosyltransferase involved in cell wall biosynthesis